MEKIELWRAKVADLKKFAKGSLKQLKGDRENLLRLIKEYDAALARLQSHSVSMVVVQKMVMYGGKPGKPKVVLRKRTNPGDFRKKLSEQRKRIPLYQGAINRSEQNGILLNTCLKRLTEAQLLLR